MTQPAAFFDALVREILSNIAPEADTDALGGNADLRDGLDIDSVDFLNFVASIYERIGVDIPERDYPTLSTVDGCVDYLSKATTITP